MAVKSIEKNGAVVHYPAEPSLSRASGIEVLPPDAVKYAQAVETAKKMGEAQGKMIAMQKASEKAKKLEAVKQKKLLLAEQLKMLIVLVKKKLEDKAKRDIAYRSDLDSFGSHFGEPKIRNLMAELRSKAPAHSSSHLASKRR